MSRDATFAALMGGSQRSAVHLETRDVYLPDDAVYADWRAGVRLDPAERWRDWFDLVTATVARGVVVRRARVVSEPVTDYIRYEYEMTKALNVAGGERVRWLSRRNAADLLVPCADFWVFDDRFVQFNHFAGDGAWQDVERTADPAVVKVCIEAFERVWDRSVDHEDYTV